MLPKTTNGCDALPCLSAMQKCIRRGLEREAMEFASELALTSKAYCSMVLNRLLIIAHEDIGLANPQAAPFVMSVVQMVDRLYNPKKMGKAMMPIGNAIRLMCRGPKSREGDHFMIAVLTQTDKGYKPTVPDWAFDGHTAKGRKLGRGVEFFLAESTKLSAATAHPPDVDLYQAEAAEIMRQKEVAAKSPPDEQNGVLSFT